MSSSELTTGSKGVRKSANVAAKAMTITTSAPAVPSGCFRARLHSRSPNGFFSASSSPASIRAWEDVATGVS